MISHKDLSKEREREREEQPLNKKDLQSFITAIKRPFGLSFLITQFSVSITHSSKMIGPIAKRLFGKR